MQQVHAGNGAGLCDVADIFLLFFSAVPHPRTCLAVDHKLDGELDEAIVALLFHGQLH